MPPPPPLAGRRLPKGEADAFGTAAGSCGCDLSAGAVVLFYAYVPVSDPAALAARIEASCAAHGVTGKLRVALEGINGTAAGPTAGIHALEALLASADETREPELARPPRGPHAGGDAEAGTRRVDHLDRSGGLAGCDGGLLRW